MATADEAAAAASHPITAAIAVALVREIGLMARQLGRPYLSWPFSAVVEQAYRSLGRIAKLLHRGEIEPAPAVCLRCGHRPRSARSRTVRLGVFPVNGNPLHWGHLLSAFEALAALELDQVVMIVQGVDARKPQSAKTQADRHALARQVVTLFAPLLAYSDVGWGNGYVGEENVFRLLQLNRRNPLVVYYVVGGDHYRLTDEAGRPDTLARLEACMANPAWAFDSTRHELRAVFVERGARRPQVPTKLAVQFIPEMLPCSSTRVRSGDLALTPHVVYRYLLSHPAYARAVGFPWQGSSLRS